MNLQKLAWNANLINGREKVGPLVALHIALKHSGLKYKDALVADDETIAFIASNKETKLLTLHKGRWSV